MANQLYKGNTPLATFVPQIADNLTTDDSTKALSAKQGKVLNDKIDARFDIVNGGGASNANLTGLTAGKVYFHVSAGGGQNFPTNGGGYLQTFLNPNTTSYGRQMYYSNEGVFTRKLQGGSWGSWTTIAN